MRKAVNWNWGWQYRVCQFFGIVPFSLLFIVFPWPVLLIQPLGVLGFLYFSKRDLARMRRESREVLGTP